MAERIDAADFFPLNGFNKWLERIPEPDRKFDPSGDWSNVYDMYSLAGRGSSIGTVCIAREKKGDRAMLVIDYHKRTSGPPALRQEAEVECSHDLLSSPLAWSFHYRVETAPGPVMQETDIRKSALCNRDGMRIETSSGKSVIVPVNGAYALNWALFDAVQRMPCKEGFATDIFTLFDHFDQRKEEHQIKYWNAFEVSLPDGRTVNLHAFEQIGRGILPIYYWVGDSGQLVAVISGIEGYILKQNEEGEVRS